ncbi:MAG: sigma-70 family RNA polymerase sigma factor [Myxococcota bacterium]|nr:sigma-70 family RNA polymerase sigma factor [Myxococcota bacterium]
MAIDVENYYRLYGPMVLRRCRKLLKDEQLAVDAMQDTFVKLIRHDKTLRHQAPSSLLYRMATNTCLNIIRSKKSRPEDPNEALVRCLVDTGESEARISARNMLGRLFRREKASTRTIAVLHLLDGMTLEEVAEEVGMSVSGVRKRLRPLRARLKELEGVSL